MTSILLSGAVYLLMYIVATALEVINLQAFVWNALVHK